VKPHAEMVHWWFATGFLALGLLLLAQALVGEEAWNRRPWRRYLWPSLLFAMGVLMWPVMTFFTSSAIHMLAHGLWAQVLMLAGAAELGIARGRLRSRWWRLTSALGMAVSGGAFLVHEQQTWLFSRAAFLHHALGWTLVAGAVFPFMQAVRPRSLTAAAGFATTFLVVAVMLYCDRDTAAIFGHLSQYAGAPHR
jgi:peptidoglycan/LPS O-acetylase OafA/YrhL